MTDWQPGGQPPQWHPAQPGPPAPPAPPAHPWPAAPYQPPPQQPPWQGPPQQPWPGPHPAPAFRPTQGMPLPPAAPLLAGAAAAVAAVLLAVLLATGSVADLFADAGGSRDDASVLAALLGVLSVAGLAGGAVAVLTGRGTGLLRVAGAAVAAAAVLLVAVSAVVEGRIAVPAVLLGLVVVLLAGGAAALAAAPGSAGWTEQAERRSAEQAIGGLSAGHTGPLPARGVASLVLSLVLVGAVVLVGVLSAVELAPPTHGSEPAAAGTGADGGDAGPIPVDSGDLEFDPDLDDLAHECADGDLGSCDRLYVRSELYGDYERYGSTCGARTEVEYSGECASRFD